MDKIVVGSAEPLLINLTDQLSLITDAADMTPTFVVYDDAGTVTQTSSAASATGMQLSCVIDTTVGTWTSARYAVYVTLQGVDGPIVKGPYYFYAETIGDT